ncbi:TolC family protein [Stutzerimonas balearica]|uniref:Cytochrome C n=1 Tax=Stutzerimonas balearica DSM 6083 TaxID=1123016 RepID=A0A8D3Y1L0_9GAMM|nr:TolC family protein [Stutzerimonas balearica]AJE15544.1 cytochrome C [Stutzerimonas balearica DSM 6083]SDM47568.1 Outer membrane protein TolC [Stutzerimonas balearica DSM 6083]
MKYPLYRARPLLAALAVGALAFAGSAHALTLAQTLGIAEQQAPSLQAQAANAQAARSTLTPAGELPDPKLKLGIQSLPIEGDNRWQVDQDGMTMQMIGLMQEVPNRAKRQARVEAAQAGVALADVQHSLARLQVRQRAAEAWIAALAVQRKLKLFAQLYDENRLFARAIAARLAGGRGQTAEGVLARQEEALLAEQEDALRRDQRIARAALARWVGSAADDPLEGDWPQWSAAPEHYRHGLAQHPALLAYEPMSRQAEARVREAVAEKTPDWSWSVDYLRRGREYGDMVNLTLSFDLPLFVGSRQGPKIAAERARLVAVEAEREALEREHRQELAADLAEYERLDRALARLDDTLLPLAEEKVALAMADYRAGRGEQMAVVEARRQRIETRLRRIDLARDRALNNARLHFAFEETRP